MKRQGWRLLPFLAMTVFSKNLEFRIGLRHFHEMSGLEIASFPRHDSILSRFCVSPVEFRIK